MVVFRCSVVRLCIQFLNLKTDNPPPYGGGVLHFQRHVLQLKFIDDNRDWKWASRCRFPSLPVRDQHSLLQKLNDGIITEEKFNTSITDIHRTLAGMKAVMLLVNDIIASEPDSALGQWYADNGFGVKKPFELNDLYVS